MPIDPFTLKQMRSGTLKSLNLQRVPMDERDWRTISDFVRSTNTLERLDLSYMGNLEMLGDALKQNRSITHLGLAQAIQDHNLPALLDVLKANPMISSINLDNCYMQIGGVSRLGSFLKTHPTLTHLSMEGVNQHDRSGVPQLGKVVEAMKLSHNILEFEPSTPETERVCATNRVAAEMLLAKATSGADTLTKDEIEDLKARLPAVVYIAEQEVIRDKTQVAQLFVNIEDAASTAGVTFPVPQRYVFAAADLPRPFKPAADKVDFESAVSIGQPEVYKAASAGQVDELVGYLKEHGRQLTAADCLVKPEGAKESVIELIARQGKLASVMTIDNWTGDPRGLKSVAAAVPAREWQRQLKNTPLDGLLSQVNAASFKQAHKPQSQARPG